MYLIGSITLSRRRRYSFAISESSSLFSALFDILFINGTRLPGKTQKDKNERPTLSNSFLRLTEGHLR